MKCSSGRALRCDVGGQMDALRLLQQRLVLRNTVRSILVPMAVARRGIVPCGGRAGRCRFAGPAAGAAAAVRRFTCSASRSTSSCSALTLVGVALFHHRTLQVALAGLAAIVVYKLAFTGFKIRSRPRRPRAAHAARMGDAREPVPAADGLRDPVAPFREEPHSGRDARPSCPTGGRAGSRCSPSYSSSRASSTTSRPR